MKESKLNVVALALALGIALTGAPSVTVAQSITADELGTKLDMASRQRMLIQRIGKDACMIVAGVDVDLAYDQLVESHDLFEASQNALVNGDATMHLPTEDNADVLAAWADVQAAWAPYEAIVKGVMDTHEMDEEQLDDVTRLSRAVQLSTQHAIEVIEESYNHGTTSLSYEFMVTLDLVGRQEMLVQQAVKDACLVFLHDGDPEAQFYIEKATELFDVSLELLMNGSDNVVPPPSPEIAEHLAAVEEHWIPIEVILIGIASGEVYPDEAILDRLMISGDALVEEIESVVLEYAHLSESSS